VTRRLREEETGSGAVLSLAMVAAVVMLGLTSLTLAAALTTRARVAGAADLAALAAADAASGLIPGAPCELAARVAEGASARLVSCALDGLVARVALSGRFADIPIDVRSAAGPPS
jgi:secretion/DNA translocation related TadE-like protein